MLGSGLLILMLGKFSLLHLVIQNNSAVVDVKMNGYVLDEKLSLMMLGLPFSSKLSFSPFCSNWGFCHISNAKMSLRKQDF